MKRGQPLERRTPLKAKAVLRASSQPKRRKRPKPVSDKRAAGADERAAVREAVFRRDGWRCRFADGRLGPCYGVLTFHHIIKASAGGAYSVENGAALCSYHNDRIEENADTARVARSLGLVKSSWEQT